MSVILETGNALVTKCGARVLNQSSVAQALGAERHGHLVDLTPLEFTILALACSVGVLVVFTVAWHMVACVRERRAEDARLDAVARMLRDAQDEDLARWELARERTADATRAGFGRRA